MWAVIRPSVCAGLDRVPGHALNGCGRSNIEQPAAARARPGGPIMGRCRLVRSHNNASGPNRCWLPAGATLSREFWSVGSEARPIRVPDEQSHHDQEDREREGDRQDAHDSVVGVVGSEPTVTGLGVQVEPRL